MDKRIYLDNAATTRVFPQVWEEMRPFFTEYYGNPSGIYEIASQAKEALTKAREAIAYSLHTNAENIYFTSGGTEADNWALISIAENYQHKGRHIITSKIEHHAILNTCSYLESRGYEITYLDVDEQGFVKVEQLQKCLRPDTILVSIMMANNEIGTLQSIYQLANIAHSQSVLFHTDAVQAFGHIPIFVDELNVDLLSASSHKFHGPKGAGILYAKDGILLKPFLHGGKQENGLRAGTENVAAIVGMGKAATLAYEHLVENQKKISQLRDYMIHRMETEIPYCHLNGPRKRRLANNVNFSFQFADGETLVILLDMEGICASAGSACTSGQAVASHVIRAIGMPDELARGTVRFSLCEDNTKEEIDETILILKKVLNKSRQLNPQYQTFVQWNSR